MIKFSKVDETRREQIVERLQAKREAYNLEIAEVNARITILNELNAEVNEVIDEARDFFEYLSGVAEEYYEERSEKWHDSDKGAAYYEWKNELNGMERELQINADEDEFPEITDDLVDMIENFKDRPDES